MVQDYSVLGREKRERETEKGEQREEREKRITELQSESRLYFEFLKYQHNHYTH